MRTSLRATKFALWVIFISSTVALVFAFGLNSIFASPLPTESDDPAVSAGKPWITVQPENGRLIATAVNFNATDWQSVGPSQLANCNSTLFETSGSGSSGNEVVLEPEDYGRYYCFQALGDMGEHVHQSYYVADNGSAIGVSQSPGDEGQTVLTASYHRPVLSWQHAGPLSSAEACSPDAFADPPSAGSSLTGETPAETSPSDYYCFRAGTSPGEWIYKSHQLRPPVSETPQT